MKQITKTAKETREAAKGNVFQSHGEYLSDGAPKADAIRVIVTTHSFRGSLKMGSIVHFYGCNCVFADERFKLLTHGSVFWYD